MCERESEKQRGETVSQCRIENALKSEPCENFTSPPPSPGGTFSRAAKKLLLPLPSRQTDSATLRFDMERGRAIKTTTR